MHHSGVRVNSCPPQKHRLPASYRKDEEITPKQGVGVKRKVALTFQKEANILFISSSSKIRKTPYNTSLQDSELSPQEFLSESIEINYAFPWALTKALKKMLVSSRE